MGLVPEARGHRWGRLLVAQAQRMAGQAGRRHLMLSVDAGNQPAVRTYTHAGFVRCDERRVLFRLLNEASSNSPR
jgi:ribosomal protein S18 acetylase RimI-like enzyme